MIESLIAQIKAGLSTDVFGGVAAAGLLTGGLGFALFQMRALPGRLIGLVRRFFVLTLTIREDDDIFHAVSLWLARHPESLKARRFQIVPRHKYGRDSLPSRAAGEQPTIDADFYRLTPGEGVRFIRHANRHWVVDRRSQGDGKPTQNGDRPREIITLSTLSRDRAVLVDLLTDITRPAEERQELAIYSWQMHGYRRVSERPRRPLDTVHIPGDVKARLIEDIARFLERRDWYAAHGIPWRRGYLLDGAPGTGKSSLIFAMAGHFNKPIYVIQPSMVINDNALHQALNEAGSGFVVIEDADSFSVARERKPAVVVNGVTSGSPYGEEGDVTLSGLLNAIDGIASEEGRILFVTSNHSDMLDAALLRPGRIDRRETLPLADAAVARAMFASFFPDASPDAFLASLTLPTSPAELQSKLIALIEGEPNPVHALQDRIAAA